MATKPRTTAVPAAAAKAAAAPAAAPTFTFGDAAVPATTRTSTVVNPLLAVCEDVKATMGDNERSSIAKTVNAADATQVAKIKRWLALAGQDLGVTFRSVVNEDNVVTFWSVKRIVHAKRKNGNGNAAK